MSYWLRTKTGKLSAPKYDAVFGISRKGDVVDWKGDPVAKVGDFVVMSGRTVNAGTVGKLVEIEQFISNQPGSAGENDWWHGTIEHLNGKRRSGIYLAHMAVIPYNAIQEVKDFYCIEEKRPDRIKVNW